MANKAGRGGDVIGLHLTGSCHRVKNVEVIGTKSPILVEGENHTIINFTARAAKCEMPEAHEHSQEPLSGSSHNTVHPRGNKDCVGKLVKHKPVEKPAV